jgi:hypothetical protein
MRYVDMCCLNPFVLNYKPFPIGHPQIITSDFGDVTDYFGQIRRHVFPSRGLYHPVLPYKTDGKLLFPLCRTFAEQHDLGPDDLCQHTDSERSLTGTWVTSELQKALQLGYRLDQIYEVWYFPENNQDLFASYINTFLKIKQEAFGFPDDFQTPEQQQRYTQDIWHFNESFRHPEESCPENHCQPVFELLVGKIGSTFTTSEISVFNRRRRITTEITRCHVRNQKN